MKRPEQSCSSKGVVVNVFEEVRGVMVNASDEVAL